MGSKKIGFSRRSCMNDETTMVSRVDFERSAQLCLYVWTLYHVFAAGVGTFRGRCVHVDVHRSYFSER